MVPLKDMNLLDDFLFNATITDSTNGEKVARIILETILGRPLKDISVQGQRVFFGSSPQKYGIRLDALITEATGDVSGNVIYDLEPDKKVMKSIYSAAQVPGHPPAAYVAPWALMPGTVVVGGPTTTYAEMQGKVAASSHFPAFSAYPC